MCVRSAASLNGQSVGACDGDGDGDDGDDVCNDSDGDGGDNGEDLSSLPVELLQ